jgi:hypothetical protein
MVIDDHNYASRLTWLSGQSVDSRFAEKFAETRYLVRFEAMCVRALEKRTLRADHKCKLVASMRLDFTQLPDQLNHFGPAQIEWKFTSKQARHQHFMPVSQMLVHLCLFLSGCCD